MSWRLASRLSVITLALLVVGVIAILGTKATTSGSSTTSALQGTNLDGVPAPDFRLTDQSGQAVSLSQFKGKPVILTFLYTHCPDVCPLTADKLHAVMQQLGSNAQRVAVLAVSTDPTGDTMAAALNFSTVHHMQDYWHFLIGTHAELSPVWSSYRMYAVPQETTPRTVTHTAAIYLIDKQGHERAFYGDDFLPEQLTSDVKILLGE